MEKSGEELAEQPTQPRSLSVRIMRRMHSHVKSRRDSTLNEMLAVEESQVPERTVSRRDKITHVIANPDALFRKDANKTPCESIFNPNPKSFLLRTFFSPNVDFGPSVSPLCGSQHTNLTLPPKRAPLGVETPIFKDSMLPVEVLAEIPAGYIMRSLTKGDYSRGFLEVLRVTGKVGYISQRRWDDRCEYLRKRSEDGEEYILVIADLERDRIVSAGRWIGEKGFMNNLASNGRIEDIAVARDQKGKKMGLRILQALVYISEQAGCTKTIVNCSENNEAFHAQYRFVKEGTTMVLEHGAIRTRKNEP